MDFIKFQESLNRHVTTLAATAANLYVTDADLKAKSLEELTMLLDQSEAGN